MTATALLEQVHALGVDVCVVGDRLRLRPASRLSPELIATLRAHKAELLAALRPERQHEDNRVGAWQPPGAITRRCPSCGSGLQPDDADGAMCSTCRSGIEHLVPRRVQ